MMFKRFRSHNDERISGKKVKTTKRGNDYNVKITENKNCSYDRNYQKQKCCTIKTAKEGRSCYNENSKNDVFKINISFQNSN